MSLAALLLLPSALAFGWGERGHHLVARDAALSVLVGVEAPSPEELALRDYFRLRALELGHVANVPDTAWRSMGKEIAALNGPTHFINAEELGVEIETLPLDYAAAREAVKPKDLFAAGTVIWRAQQLYELMVAELKKAARLEPGGKAFKAAVHRAAVAGGLMAHFVGDAAQPFHDTLDHDGYGAGHGGIHSYFETDGLNTETPAFEQRVFERVPKAYADFDVDAKFKKGGDKPAAYLTRALAAEARSRVKEIVALDEPLLVYRSKSAAPGQRQYPAKRKGAEEGEAAFRPIVDEQLSLAAACLARLWRGAWEEAGKPDLSKAKSWEYAHKPAFVEPSYR